MLPARRGPVPRPAFVPAVAFMALLPLFAACSGGEAPATAAAPALPEATAVRSDDPAARRIEDDVRVLADDRMQGRETGSPGHALAAAHVAGRFADAGLEPAGEDGGWLQPVPLLRASLLPEGARMAVALDGRSASLAFEEQFVPMANFNRSEATIEAPAVFVGQAVDAPGLGHDDFAGLDLRGKVAVMLGGAPAHFADAPRAVHASLAGKLRAVARRGAVGAVIVNTAHDEAGTPWTRSAAGWNRPTMRLRDADGRGIDAWPELQVVARVSAAAADIVFAGTERSAARLADEARAGTLRGFDMPVRISLAVRSRVESLDSHNVVGRLPGSDPTLAAEHVVHTAHLDHVGLGIAVDGDDIYNGALDNALGVAIMTEAARTLAAEPQRPRRPQLFAAVTGEEQGLLGSQWLARHLPVPDGVAIANINIDMPVLMAPSRDVVAVGIEHSSLAAVVEEAAAALGVEVSPDPFPEDAVFVRSDQYSFVRAGVPAVYLQGGVEPADEARDPRVSATWFMRNCYHRPCDQADLPIHYDDAARLARLSARIARGIADADARPEWKPGDWFAGDAAGAEADAR